jgi:large subunit ribosomal protein L29
VKSTQTLNELRTMEGSELNARLKEVRTELFNLRFQAATGQLENHRQIRNVRRQIAQVLTVLSGRQLGIEDIVSAETPVAAPAPQAAAEPEPEPEPVVEEPAEADDATEADDAKDSESGQAEEKK